MKHYLTPSGTLIVVRVRDPKDNTDIVALSGTRAEAPASGLALLVLMTKL